MSSPVRVTSSGSPGSSAPPTATPTESPYIRVSSLKKGISNLSTNPTIKPCSTTTDIYQQVKSSSNSSVQSNSKSSSSIPSNTTGGSLSLPPVQLLSSTNFNNTNTPTSRTQHPVLVPSSSQFEDEESPFVVTVRQSPVNRERERISKSSSGSYILSGGGGRTPSNKSPVGIGPGPGPRLALYRSNSSLDLLDRDNYLLHHHQRLGYHHSQGYHNNNGGQIVTSPGTRSSLLGGGVGAHHSHAHQEVKGHTNQNSIQAQHNQSYTGGCFPRRKDFGSHGSIDMLSTSSGGPPSSGAYKPERSGSLGNSSHFLSLLSSSSNSNSSKVLTSISDPSNKTNNNSSSVGSSNNRKNDSFSTDKNSSNSSGKGGLKESASPRLRLKLQKLWEHKEPSSASSKESSSKGQQQDRVLAMSTSNKSEASIFRKLRGASGITGSSSSSSSNRTNNSKSLPEGVKFEILNSEGVNEPLDECDGGGGGANNAKVTLRHEKQTQQLMDERYRRRVLGHFDCQSVSANISYAARLRGILSKRRNTTTGASAASLAQRPLSHSVNNGNGSGSGGGNNPLNIATANLHHLTVSANCSSGAGGQPSSLDNNTTFSSSGGGGGDVPDPDVGDDKSNALVLSCPYFRNEVGGERERLVSLSRLTGLGSGVGGLRASFSSRDGLYGATRGNWGENCHRSFQARGISLLELPGGGRGTYWTNSHCPFASSNAVEGQSLLEAKDLGATYYRRHFHGQDHENWFGLDENLGPLAISVKKEKVEETDKSKNLYRIIVRSSELNTIRGSILEESVPGVKTNSTKVNSKELIEFLLPEVQLSCLKLGVQSKGTEDQLLKLDEQGLTKRHKVGVMYCKAGQGTEEEMYNNEGAGPAFTEFLDLIGQRIRLKGFDKYTGGLDNKDDSTGLHSVYSTYQDCEVIFHVSTLLPFTPNNRQQLMRKRHIGNDIVTIVFQEPGALPFTPKSIRSQFQHVFIIVRAINPCSDSTHYTVSVSRSREVPLFGPPIPQGAKFPKNKEFIEFLLAKVINAENATYRSEKFTTMATRTRQEYLKDLVANYSTNSPIDPRPKFSMLQFGGNKKKDLTKPRFNGDSFIKGALSWAVWVEEINSDSRIDAYLAISTDSLVIIDASSREPIFAIPCASLLAWNSSMSNRLRMYYHQGECVTIRGKGDSDKLLEIVARLEAVTKGSETLEFVLRRSEGAQLGFHVQQDGVITEVEPSGCASKAGLRQGSRLVEICKVAVATLTQDEMIEMLKTSSAVVLMVVPPFSDNSPRRGCIGMDCPCVRESESNNSSVGELYENIHLNGRGEGGESPSHPQTHFKQNPHRKKYEPRGFSPPRSSNSSGYGTGSSSKSFSSASIDPNVSVHPIEGEALLTSSSSGVSSGEERWYDITDTLKDNQEPNPSSLILEENTSQTPPPIPARNTPNLNQISRQSPSRTPQQRDNFNGSLTSNTNTSVNATPSASNGKTKQLLREKQQRDFFQRSSPHHNSFHTKLSPSRSHDMLHLKNLYGLHQPLRPFPSASIGPDSKAFDRGSPYNGGGGGVGARTFSVGGAVQQHGKLTREHSSLGVPGERNYVMSNGSKSLYGNAIENTVRGKVTYLTDFPPSPSMTHSHSTEHMTTVGLPLTPNNKDINVLKNERVAALKSAYLEKHRALNKPSVSSGYKAESFRPILPSGEESPKQRPVSLPLTPSSGVNCGGGGPTSIHNVKGTPNSSSDGVKLRSYNGNGGGGLAARATLNRSSTLQEDLLRLIGPDSLNENDAKVQQENRPVSSNSISSLEGPSTDLYSRRVTLPTSTVAKPYPESSTPLKRSSWDERPKRHSLLLDSPSVEADLRLQEVSPTHQQQQRLTSSRLSNGATNSVSPWHTSSSSGEAESDSPRSPGPPPSTPSTPVIPIGSVFNLEARVSQLEAELRKEQESKEMLAVTVASLQQENRRLQQESTSTQKEFSKFKEWLLHSVDPQNPSGQS